MRELPLPVIAAVHGRALAGGCGLASAADPGARGGVSALWLSGSKDWLRSRYGDGDLEAQYFVKQAFDS